jgi:RNA polymerase sigma-70 factor (ECF subfamily)
MVNGVMTAPSDEPSAPPEADRNRLERMFVSHHKVVWRVLRRRGLTEDAAAEATQQTFLLAAERLADIKPESERAFLIQSALRVAYALARKVERWELEQDMDERLSDDRDTGDRRADIQLCDLALSRVSADLAEVFVLYELQGMSAPEIADLLHIPLGSVASRLRRAREQFRAAAARLERATEREGKA